MESQEYISKKLLLSALVVSVGLLAVGLLLLTSCTMVLNQTEGEAKDTVETDQKADPEISIPYKFAYLESIKAANSLVYTCDGDVEDAIDEEQE